MLLPAASGLEKTSCEVSVLAWTHNRSPPIWIIYKIIKKLILCYLAACTVELMGRALYAKLQFNELSHPDCCVYTSHYHWRWCAC